MEPTKHQYDYDTATVHGFLVRHGLEGEYRLNIEANHATLAGHSFHHEVAYAVAHGMLGSIDANRGDPRTAGTRTSSPTRSRTSRSPLYEILRAGGLATGGFNFDAKLRRQSMRPDRPVPRPHRRHRHARPRAAGRRGHGRGGTLDALREARYAGWDGRARHGDPRRRRSRSRRWPTRVASGEIDPQPRVGPPGAAREHREPVTSGRSTRRADGRPGLTHMAFVLGIDASTTATKAVLVDPDGRVVRGIGVAGVRRSTSRARCGASRTRRYWWDGDRGGHPGRARGDRHDGADGRRGRADRPDARRASCWTRPARCSGRRSSGTTSGPAPSATRSGRRSGPSASSPSPATTRSPGSPPRSSCGSATTSPTSGAGSPTCSCRRTTSASG